MFDEFSAASHYNSSECNDDAFSQPARISNARIYAENTKSERRRRRVCRLLTFGLMHVVVAHLDNLRRRRMGEWRTDCNASAVQRMLTNKFANILKARKHNFNSAKEASTSVLFICI